MFKKNVNRKKVTINTLLIILAIICSLFAVGMILLPFINKGNMETKINNLNEMQINYTSTESNTWDVSENGDGSVIATLSEDGTLTISGTGNMKNWKYSSSVSWYSVREQIKQVNIHEGVTSIGDSAFDGCSSLTNIKVDANNTKYSDDNGVLYIKDKTKIIKYPEGKKDTKYTILNGVTSIGSYAFYECSSLEKITIPEGVTSIGDSAFEGCSSLAEITIPSSVTSIGSYAFMYCISLTEITMPEGVTSIGANAFLYCSSLTEITIPSSVTSIEGSPFGECSNLTNIKVCINNTEYCDDNGVLYTKDKTEIIKYPKGKRNSIYEILSEVTSIGDMAFYGCSSLTEIIIPEGVTGIGSYAFYECSSLEKITIPEGVTSIGNDVFWGCKITNLITIENDTVELPSILKRAQNETDILYSSEEFTLINCTIVDGKVRIKDGAGYASIKVEGGKLQGLTYIVSYDEWDVSENGDGSVTAILDEDGLLTISGTGNMKNWSYSDVPWYSVKEQIKQVKIEEGVTSIGEYAFYVCSSLTEITIPEGVTRIGDYAFYGCSSLTEITIPEGVTSIGDDTFYGCSSLKEITIPSSVTSIGSYAFIYCRSLTEITIPSSVTSIENNAFNGCSSLTEIKVDENNTKYLDDNGVLYAKDKTEIIKYPQGKKDTTYVILSGVTRIGSYAFTVCRSLTEITIPEEVTSIGQEAFYECSSLEKITIPEGVTSIGSYAFTGCRSLIEITIPSRVTRIGSGAFYECSSLTEITIPSSVTSIGDYAFYRCSSLTQMIIPSSVITIGTNVFKNCSNLTMICYKDSVAETYAQENEIPYKIKYLSSTQQQIDEIKQIVRKIKTKTTVEQIKTDIQSGISYEILDKEGNVIEDTSIIGTGCVIKLSDGSIYTLIVMGDINGDGKIGISELARASRIGISQGDATEIEKMAIDINMDGNIKVNDLAAISRMARE